MRCCIPLILITGCILSGCAVPAATSTVEERGRRSLLNSERIELTFGSYGIEILEQSDTLRVSNLYSLSDTRKVCRTFAVVSYFRPVDHRLMAEHARIIAGGSIGAVFKSAGWTVEKRHLYFGAIQSQPAFGRVLALMEPLDAEQLAVHVYALSVERAGASVAYATLVEVHHPDYLTLEDLRALYESDPAVDAGRADGYRRALEVAIRAMRGM